MTAARTPHDQDDATSLAEQVAGRRWYHTIALSASVTTPGWFDTRKVAGLMPWPRALAGGRCLDVGTFDGFWAFEMERRGAAEVVAVDILDEDRWDWPPRVDPHSRQGIEDMKRQGRGFEIARAALGSAVERVDCSIYDLDPRTHGRFDVVFVGSLLLHLRDPVLALSRVARVTAGTLVVSDAVSGLESLRHPRKPLFELDGVGRPYWWRPNVAGLRRLLLAGGFEQTTRVRPFLMPAGRGHPRPTVRQGLRTPAGRELLMAARLGDPHACVAARAAA